MHIIFRRAVSSAAAVAWVCLVGTNSAPAQQFNGPKIISNINEQPINEVRVGTNNVGYNGLEFSPSMKYMAWQESTNGKLGSVWICSMDPNTAALIPSSGKGIEIPNILPKGASQWGVDKQGEFLMVIDNQGRLLQVRVDSSGAASTNIIPIPNNKSRAFPYPSRLPERDEAYVIFTQNDPQQRKQLWVVDLAKPTIVTPITSGAVDMFNNSPSFWVTIYRWFAGLPIFTYGYNDALGKIQIEQVDVSGVTPTITSVTTGSYHHVDDFPFVNSTRQKSLVGGVGFQATGALYTYNPATNLYQSALQFAPVGSAFTTPKMLASAEPFIWSGKTYASFLVLNNGYKPGMVPGEIWVTGLSQNDQPSRVSGTATLNRMDPEFFLGNSKVWIFYNAPSTSAPSQLLRADTAL